MDCHVHLGPSDSGEVYYGRLEGPEYLELMPPAGLTHAIAFPPLRHGGYASANRTLLEWCDALPPGGPTVRPLARVGGDRIPVTEPQLWLVRKAARARVLATIGRRRAADVATDQLDRYAGIKLLPHLDGLPGDDVFDAVNQLGRPVLTHAGRYVTPDWIAKTVLPRVRGRLVLAHLGAFPDREADLKAAVALAEREPRVVLDPSGIWIEDFWRYAIERVPRQIVFGSDCPLTAPAVAWAFLEHVVRDPGLRRHMGGELPFEVFDSVIRTREPQP